MLAIKWTDPGPAEGTTDLIPRWWFADEGEDAWRQHLILFNPEGRGYIRCSVKVTGRTVDLDYEGEHAEHNRALGYILGVTRLIFDDESRTGDPKVEWRYEGSADFKSYAPEITERSFGQEEAAAFDPNDDHDGREKMLAMVAIRQGQSDFRGMLLRAYDGQCAVTGCRVEEVLEAAHIQPYRGKHTNHVQNGLLLRADIHTLFDLGIIRIGRDYRIDAPAGIIKAFDLPERITLPKNEADHPSPDAFDAKWA